MPRHPYPVGDRLPLGVPARCSGCRITRMIYPFESWDDWREHDYFQKRDENEYLPGESGLTYFEVKRRCRVCGATGTFKVYYHELGQLSTHPHWREVELLAVEAERAA